MNKTIMYSYNKDNVLISKEIENSLVSDYKNMGWKLEKPKEENETKEKGSKFENDKKFSNKK